MDKIVTPKEAAALLYGEARKASVNVVVRHCADGTIRHAEKVGSRWYINATREWPNLFGQAEPEPAPELRETRAGQARITVDTTVGELLAMLLGRIVLEDAKEVS